MCLYIIDMGDYRKIKTSKTNLGKSSAKTEDLIEHYKMFKDIDAIYVGLNRVWFR